MNTTDNTVEYEAAFAMVYVTDSSDAMNVNEAHAYASCNSCAAVAVAYEVVFVIDTDLTNDNVAVPQNLAGALNYDCVNCLTYALARQLFVTLDEPLSEEATIQVGRRVGQGCRLRSPDRSGKGGPRRYRRAARRVYDRDQSHCGGRPARHVPDNEHRPVDQHRADQHRAEHVRGGHAHSIGDRSTAQQYDSRGHCDHRA